MQSRAPLSVPNLAARKSRCFPIVVAEHSCQPRPSSDSCLAGVGVGGQRLDAVVSETLVIPLAMIMLRILRQNASKMPFAQGNDPGEALRLTEPTGRLANVFKLGLRNGRRTGLTPLAFRMLRKAAE